MANPWSCTQMSSTILYLTVAFPTEVSPRALLRGIFGFQPYKCHHISFEYTYSCCRASDKRKNMAAQKAEAQKRLLRPTKKFDGDPTDWQKHKVSVEKKKEELVRKKYFFWKRIKMAFCALLTVLYLTQLLSFSIEILYKLQFPLPEKNRLTAEISINFRKTCWSESGRMRVERILRIDIVEILREYFLPTTSSDERNIQS